MEDKIKEIINSLENFEIADFIMKDEERPNTNSYFVQLIQNNHNVELDTRNFDSRADILISFDRKQINVYERIRSNISKDDRKRLMKPLNNSFPEITVTHTLWKN